VKNASYLVYSVGNCKRDTILPGLIRQRHKANKPGIYIRLGKLTVVEGIHNYAFLIKRTLGRNRGKPVAQGNGI
jgi:hypothetical protein